MYNFFKREIILVGGKSITFFFQLAMITPQINLIGYDTVTGSVFPHKAGSICPYFHTKLEVYFIT